MFNSHVTDERVRVRDLLRIISLPLGKDMFWFKECDSSYLFPTNYLKFAWPNLFSSDFK